MTPRAPAVPPRRSRCLPVPAPPPVPFPPLPRPPPRAPHDPPPPPRRVPPGTGAPPLVPCPPPVTVPPPGAEAEAEPRWEPVPAAELRSRRERQDRVSQALGRFLLRGYRMLGSCCPRCGTILLQDKQQQLLCVTCHELDGERDGDALESPPAAPQPAPPCHPAAPRPEHCEGAASGRRGGVPHPAAPPPGPEVAAAAAAVLQKLGWAARELPRTASAEGSAQLCALVRACAEALRALRGLDAPPGTPPGPQTP
uniref:Sjoegren syndrome/scleroderma autoantigen 1 n=1 Tax=Cairina moschata TaxID=8855 RepID=A0A8C3CH22_CAIMO